VSHTRNPYGTSSVAVVLLIFLMTATGGPILWSNVHSAVKVAYVLIGFGSIVVLEQRSRRQHRSSLPPPPPDTWVPAEPPPGG